MRFEIPIPHLKTFVDLLPVGMPLGGKEVFSMMSDVGLMGNKQVSGGIKYEDVSEGDWYLYKSKGGYYYLFGILYKYGNDWIVIRDSFLADERGFNMSIGVTHFDIRKFRLFTNINKLTPLLGGKRTSHKFANVTSGLDRTGWRWGSWSKARWHIRISPPSKKFINWTGDPFGEVKE